MTAGQDGELGGALPGADADQELRLGRRDLGGQGAGGEVAVGQHDHARPQAAQQRRSVGGLPAGGRAEHRVDEGAGAAGHQRQQPDLGVAGAAVVARVLGEPGQVRRAVGHRQDGAVDRAHQQPVPPCPALARGSGRAAQQIKQEPQRRGPDPAPRLGQRPRGRCRRRDTSQPSGELAPHPRIPQLREQAPGQQQVDHHPRRQGPYPPLHAARLSQRLIHHLKRHQLGQFPR